MSVDISNFSLIINLITRKERKKCLPYRLNKCKIHFFPPPSLLPLKKAAICDGLQNSLKQ